jgi:hypothetical protein
MKLRCFALSVIISSMLCAVAASDANGVSSEHDKIMAKMDAMIFKKKVTGIFSCSE